MRSVGTRLDTLYAAVEMLELPDLEPAMRERFQAVVHDEVQGMGRRVAELQEDIGIACKKFGNQRRIDGLPP